MASEFVTGNPWYYTPLPYPVLNPNFYHPPPDYTPQTPPHVTHPFQPLEYSPPPTPPYVYHPPQPPPYYTPPTPSQLLQPTHTQSFHPYTTLITPDTFVPQIQPSSAILLPPAICAPQVFDESPVTLMSNSDDTRYHVLDRCKEMLQQLEKMDEICKGICSNMVSQSPPMSTCNPAVKNNENVEDDNVSVLGGEIVLMSSGDASEGGEVVRREGDSENWNMLKEGNEDDDLDVFTEAEESVNKVASDKGEGYWATAPLWDLDNEKVDDVDDMCLFGYAVKMFDGSSEKVWKVDVDKSEENDVGLFASAKYDEDDKEVDVVWEKIENKMDLWMKDRREARAKQGIESLADSIADTLLEKARQEKGTHYEMPIIRSPLDSFVGCGKFYEKFCVNCENSITATRMFDIKSETKSVKVLNYKHRKDEHGEYLLKWRYKDRDKGRCDGNRSTIGASQLAKPELCHAYEGMVHRVVELDEWHVEEKKGIMAILVDAPGNGKSTFCPDVIEISNQPWIRVCQDTTGNGKTETKVQWLTSAATALKEVEGEIMCYRLHEDGYGKVSVKYINTGTEVFDNLVTETARRVLTFFIARTISEIYRMVQSCSKTKFNGNSVRPNVYFEDDVAVNLVAEWTRSKRIKCGCCGVKELSCRWNSNGVSNSSWLLSGRLAKMILIDCEKNESCYPLVISVLDFTVQLVKSRVENDVVMALTVFATQFVLLNYEYWNYKVKDIRWKVMLQVLEVIKKCTLSFPYSRKLGKVVKDILHSNSSVHSSLFRIVCTITEALEELYVNRPYELLKIEGIEMVVGSMLNILFSRLSEISRETLPGFPVPYQAVLSSTTKPIPAVAAMASLTSYFRNPAIQVRATRLLSMMFFVAYHSQVYISGNTCFGQNDKQIIDFRTGSDSILCEQSPCNEVPLITVIKMLTSAALSDKFVGLVIVSRIGHPWNNGFDVYAQAGMIWTRLTDDYVVYNDSSSSTSFTSTRERVRPNLEPIWKDLRAYKC